MTNYVPEILLFVEKNLLEPPDRSGVYLSQIPSTPQNNLFSAFPTHVANNLVFICWQQ